MQIVSAKGMLVLAKMYLAGLGVEEDVKQGCHWMRQAADEGNVRAMKWCGDQRSLGEMLEKDAELAREWWLKAAEKGDQGAMVNLGISYYEGDGHLSHNSRESRLRFQEG